MTPSDLRKAASCIYIAVEERVAKDISAKLLWAANEIEKLQEAEANAIQRTRKEMSLTSISFLEGYSQGKADGIQRTKEAVLDAIRIDPELRREYKDYLSEICMTVEVR